MAKCKTQPCYNCGSLSQRHWKTCDGTAKSFYLCVSTENEGEETEGEDPRLTTYSSVVKKTIKPRDNTKFVFLVTMNMYSAFAAADTDSPISPKQSIDKKLVFLSPKKRNEEELASSALSADDDAWMENLSDI